MVKSTGRFGSGQQVGDCYYRPRFQPVGTQALAKQRSVRRDSVLEVGFPRNPVLHALNATGLALPLPTRRLKIDPRRGSDVISNTGERREPLAQLDFLFFSAAQSRLCALSCLGNPSAIKRGSIHFYDFRVFLRVWLQVRVCVCLHLDLEYITSCRCVRSCVF